jgi:hypothetical protein
MLKSLKAIIWITASVLNYDASLNTTLTCRERTEFQLYIVREYSPFVLLTKMNNQLFY